MTQQAWLEEELPRQLCPVRAPEALWERIHEQRRPLRVSRSLGPGAVIATIVLVILTAGFSMRFVSTPDSPQASIDIGVPQSASCANGSPSLLGARLIRWKGQPVVYMAELPGPQTGVQAACILCHT